MRHYEVVLLVHPDQSDQLSDMLKRYQDLVTKNGGNVHRVEDMGRLQLAYTIKDMHKAHYVLMNLECDGKTLSEIESSFEFNDSIMRHLIVRMTKAETTPSKLFLLHNKDVERKQIDPKIITEIISILNSCEYARYAPTDQSNGMDQIYELALNIISKIEKSLK